MSIIEATCAGFKDMPDGTVRFLFDVEPRHAAAALYLFRVRGTAAALAALQTAPEAATAPEKAVPETSRAVGPICKWLALRCKELEFRMWLGVRLGANNDIPLSEEQAALGVRVICDVASRRDIDGNPEAESKFQLYIRGPWLKHQLARGAITNTKEH